MRLRKCEKCNVYTLKENCPKCGMITISPHPIKFSPEDKWGVYRRKARLESKEKT